MFIVKFFVILFSIPAYIVKFTIFLIVAIFVIVFGGIFYFGLGKGDLDDFTDAIINCWDAIVVDPWFK